MKHREAYRQKRKARYERDKEKELTRAQAWKKQHADHVREYTRKWRAAHPDKVREYNRRAYAKSKQQQNRGTGK